MIIDKPKGMTSHDVVDFIRKRFHLKKVGHAGTLDPLATGVLVILVGKATKLSGTLTGHDKEYDVMMTLGRRTDTGDADGKVISDGGDFSKITVDTINAAFTKFLGHIPQKPPMTSAVKFKGKKLYELARQGIEIERPSRMINIKELELLTFDAPNVSFRVKCTKGTYVRVLCDDIGLALGCGAYVSQIRRTRSGDFSIKESLDLSRVREIKGSELPYFLKNENYYKFTPSR